MKFLIIALLSFSMSSAFAENTRIRIKLKKIEGVFKTEKKIKKYTRTNIQDLDSVLTRFRGTAERSIDTTLPTRKISQKENRRIQKYLMEVEKRGLDKWIIIEIPEEEFRDTIIDELKNSPDIKQAYIIPPNTASITPNDPGVSSRTPSLDLINAFQGWDNTIGNGAVKVGIMDTGIEKEHEDLAANTISRGVAHGDTPDQTGLGHGTHVAGIVGATTNNNLGVPGIIWNVNLYPYKVVSAFPGQVVFDTVQQINMAVIEGMDILNMSFRVTSCSGVDPDPALGNAIASARAAGVIVVAAMGNCNCPNDCSITFFPAAYPGVISVANVDNNGNRVSSSSTGTHVDLSAPGLNILSTNVNDSYRQATGTSMSAPHVTGLVALMLSKHGFLSETQITDILYSTAIDVDQPGFDNNTGHGVMDIQAALTKLDQTIGYENVQLWYQNLSKEFGSAKWKRLVGDTNADGRSEPIFIDRDLNEVLVFNNTGSSFLEGASWLNEGHNVRRFWEFLTGDFNGDSRADIVAIDSAQGRADVSLSQGSFYPGMGFWVNEGDSSRQGWKFLTGDFTGNNRDDIVAIDKGQTRLDVAVNSTGSNFNNFGIWVNDATNRSSWEFVKGDFNGDSRDDIAAINPGQSRVDVATSAGSGFSFLSVWVNDGNNRSGWIYHSADMNLDGKDDIVAVYQPTGRIDIAYSTGSGFTIFQPTYSDGSNYSSQSVFVSKFNSDNKPDVLYFHPSSPAARVLLKK